MRYPAPEPQIMTFTSEWGNWRRELKVEMTPEGDKLVREKIGLPIGITEYPIQLNNIPGLGLPGLYMGLHFVDVDKSELRENDTVLFLELYDGKTKHEMSLPQEQNKQLLWQTVGWRREGD